ncbi:MAG: adenosylcobinamide-GDP ribazoletransferase [Acidimicrobiia bacterium]|nr:adenosylcobinamide-GDP ribazoletransferase [Acidimicrobiia bacterium]
MGFLTRVPVGERAHGVALPRTLPWFPAVGLLVGLVVGIVAAVVAAAVDPLTGAAVAVAVGALVTGGLHEDGLADTADGFGGGWTPEERLAIMDDSRQGTFGVLAVVASVAIRVAAVAHLAGDRTGPAGPWTVVLAAPVAHLAARAWAVAALVTTPPARGEGLGWTAGAPGGRWASSVLALALGVWAVVAVLVAGPVPAVAALAAGGAATLAVVSLSRRKIGGLTGDVAGAIEQLAEMAALTAMAAVAGPGRPWLAGLW